MGRIEEAERRIMAYYRDKARDEFVKKVTAFAEVQPEMNDLVLMMRKAHQTTQDAQLLDTKMAKYDDTLDQAVLGNDTLQDLWTRSEKFTETMKLEDEQKMELCRTWATRMHEQGLTSRVTDPHEVYGIAVNNSTTIRKEIDSWPKTN